jgi:hypothetical protein
VPAPAIGPGEPAPAAFLRLVSEHLPAFRRALEVSERQQHHVPAAGAVLGAAPPIDLTAVLSYRSSRRVSRGLTRVYLPARMIIVVISPTSPNSSSASATTTLRLWDLPDGCLRKEDSKAEVYPITNGQKRHVTSPLALDAIGRSSADVRSVPDEALKNIPTGPPISVPLVGVSPMPVPLNAPVQVVVSAVDPATQSPVAGMVKIDGQQVGNTNTPFTHTFRVTRRRVRNPDGSWDIVIVEPTGIVSAPGHLDAVIDFGW